MQLCHVWSYGAWGCALSEQQQEATRARTIVPPKRNCAHGRAGWCEPVADEVNERR
jgi:hypothetical protein